MSLLSGQKEMLLTRVLAVSRGRALTRILGAMQKLVCIPHALDAFELQE
jgi:hypothetical protein